MRKLVRQKRFAYASLYSFAATMSASQRGHAEPEAKKLVETRPFAYAQGETACLVESKSVFPSFFIEKVFEKGFFLSPSPFHSLHKVLFHKDKDAGDS